MRGTYLCIAFMLLWGSIMTGQDLSKSVLTIPKDLSNGANAVTRLNDMKVTLKSKNSMTIQMTRVVTVLNKSGNSSVDAFIHYDNENKLKALDAVIYNAMGIEIKKIKKKDFKDVSAVDGVSLYSDARVTYLDYTPVSYPYTVMFTYEMETSNTAFIPSWYPIRNYNAGIEKSVFTIDDMAGLGVRYKEKNFRDDIPIERSEEGSIITYSAKNITPIKPEDVSPIFNDIVPMVLFATSNFHLEGVDGAASDWESMGAWQYNNLVSGRDLLSENTRNKILRMVEGIDDPMERARIVYQYVQDNTRYISVQVGIGGWMPIAASTVDDVKYGDCKGLTNYTKALLKVVGVESYYAVVYGDREKRSLEPDFASMQGNHVILNLPTDNGDVWLECTSQIVPFGFLGDFTDDREVLVLTPEGGKIKRTTVFPDEGNHQLIKAAVTLNSNGGFESEVSIETKALQYDNHFYLERLSKDEMVEHYKKYWSYINNLSVNKHELTNDKMEITFKEEVNLSATGYASITGNRMIFAPNVFNKNRDIPDRYKERLNPVLIERGFLDEDEYVIQLPEGYEIEAMGEKETLDTKFGTYELQFSKNDDHSIAVYRKLIIHQGKYPKEDYEGYRNFQKDIARIDNSKIVLIKKN